MALTTIDDRGLKTPIDLLDNEKIRFGTGNDLEFYHNGTDSVIDNNTGDLVIRGDGDDLKLIAADDILLMTQTSEVAINCIGNGAVNLYYDDSLKFATTSSGVLIDGSNTGGSEVRGDFRFKSESSGTTKIVWDGSDDLIRFFDSSKAVFGTSDDLQIWHDGSFSYIKDANASSALIIEATNDTFIKHGSETCARFNNDGSVELYYDNVKKLETTTTGYKGGDNVKAGFGNDGDLHIYHDGSNSYIDNATGNLYIRSGGNHIVLRAKDDEQSIQCDPNGAVQLFYDSVKKFETTSTGVSVTGNTISSGSIIIGDTDSDNANSHFDDLVIGANASTTETHGITIVSGNASTNGGIAFSDGSNGGADAYRGMISYQHNDNHMQFRTNGSERVRITSAGDLQFNSTEMQVHLATSDGSDNGYLNIGAAGAANNQNRGAQAVFYGNEHSSYPGQCGLLAGNSGSTAGYIYFRTGGSERMRILSSGGLTFNGDSAADNALDDYEEGTWVPTVNSNMTLNTSYDQFGYVKVGAMVTVRGLLDVSAVSGTDAVTLSLPFTPSNWSERSNRGGTGAMFKHVGGDYGTVAAYTANGNVNMHFYRCQGNDSAWSSVSNSNISTSTQIYFQHTYFHG